MIERYGRAPVWLRTIYLAAAALLVAVTVMLFGATVLTEYADVRIDGSSMAPTLADGDDVAVVRSTRASRGDVVVFRAADYTGATDADGNSANYIKRVIAVGGDTLWFAEKDGIVTVSLRKNGEEDVEPLAEDYILSPMRLDCISHSTDKSIYYALKSDGNAVVTIAENTYWCMGDNRNDSLDSRDFGAVRADDLFGVMVDADYSRFADTALRLVGWGRVAMWVGLAVTVLCVSVPFPNVAGKVEVAL